MKIKFIKEYVAVAPDTNLGIVHRYRPGETEEIKGYTAQWLIDNGFAEEVIESGWWKPQENDGFWSISSDGTSFANIWGNDCYDNGRMDIGNVFKTEEAADRFANYLKAVATVRQDEGVLTPEQINERQGDSGLAYHVGSMGKQNGEEVLCGCVMDLYNVWAPLGAILFDTEEHADASRNAHQEEWKIIANYDWSRE